ncbi:MAG: Eco57I restriction-modification methylase domain-containing protein [Polyangiaceae bacterium]
MINDGLPADAYRAQDFLGWVYQFFVGRPAAGEKESEKDRVRRETKGTPRSSYELSVLNQFYTPSWVVKALVDNTLGRLWLQMHPDSALAAKVAPPLPGQRTSDVAVADYLVPRTGERIRYQRLTDDGQVEEFKRALDITLIDPACGTMHFGQYAFGLFHRMYLDEIENAGKPGWPAEPSVKDPRAIPATILERNLFGIDIDPRAIQIASLSLMLTAKEASLQNGFSPLDVKVRRSNLVVANAVNLGAERLKQLVDHIGSKLGSPELRERLFKTLWDNLQHVGELGSLVQVREGVGQVLDDWVDARAKDKGLTKLIRRKSAAQLDLGGILTDSDRDKAKQLELERSVLENEAAQLQQELLVAIEEAAAQTATEPAERLFAEDTARGLKLLQMLGRHYDVAVMNPPYGSFVPKVKEFVKAAYPLTSNDIYAAFIDRGTQLTEPEGYVGALVSRTFVAQSSAEKFRTEILLRRNPLVLLLDVGLGILDDATVEAAALVIRGGVG